MTDLAAAMTSLFLETFRLNGELLSGGDRLVAELGLTSARWQVLGAVAISSEPLPVAAIARNMGLSRQAVQRIANDLSRDRLVAFQPNPRHARAQLVVMTATGARAFAAAMDRQRPWACDLGAGLAVPEIEAATALMRCIRRRLDSLNANRKRGNHDTEKHR